MGTVVSPESMLTVSSGSVGSCGISADSLSWIAPAAFDQGKKRLNNPINYAFLLSMMDPVVTEANVEGNKVRMKVFVFEPGRKLEVAGSANALDLLAKPLVDAFGDFTDGESKLARFLAGQMEAKEYNFASELFSRLANGMVLGCEVRRLKAASHPDFDGLKAEEVAEWMRKDPWAEWEVEIEATDAAWLEHLPGATPFVKGYSHVEAAEAWEGDLLRWEG